MPLQGPTNLFTVPMSIPVTEHGYGAELIDPKDIGDRMSCSLVHIHPNHGFELHTHPSDHLIIVKTGSGIFTYWEDRKEKKFDFKMGDVFASPKDMPHAVTAGPQGVTFIAIGTPARTLSDPERTHFVAAPDQATVPQA